MSKKKLFNELRTCAKVALACSTYRSASISVNRADGMISLAFAYDIINERQFQTLQTLRSKFDSYLLDNK